MFQMFLLSHDTRKLKNSFNISFYFTKCDTVVSNDVEKIPYPKEYNSLCPDIIKKVTYIECTCYIVIYKVVVHISSML